MSENDKCPVCGTSGAQGGCSCLFVARARKDAQQRDDLLSALKNLERHAHCMKQIFNGAVWTELWKLCDEARAAIADAEREELDDGKSKAENRV